MKKRFTIITGSICLVALVVAISSQFFPKKIKDVAGVEYRTDREPIENRFPDLPSFTECYWKADTIGSISFGPTNYWMQGFVSLDERGFQEVLSTYEWKPASVAFPKGLDPSITGRNDFCWYSNGDFQTKILKQNFVGSIFLDTTNGIIYFDVENN